ncbi:MAG: hypothetical protein ACNA7V_09985 [Bacteroidales bacterium]
MSKETIVHQISDFYFMVKNQQDGFYWVINLENHYGSFILDKSNQNFLPPEYKEDQKSMVIIQPNIYS